jgi:ribonucleoside-triphosphate reductase
MHLKAKYSHKLFDLDGIGEQTDMSKFSKKFFSAKTTSDASVDANANVDDVSVIAYNVEMPKPFFKLNSYYILWKELRRLYGHEVANTIIEMQLTGDIYIHDFHGVAAGMPYSYHKDSILVVDINNKIKYITMEELFNTFKNLVTVLPDRETIDLSNQNIKILDKTNKFVQLKHVLRHKNTEGLLKIETKNGFSTIVTNDHPVILNDGTEKRADNLSLSDDLAISDSILPLFPSKHVEEDFAYLIGFMLGDGWLQMSEGKVVDIRRGNISIRQNNIENSKVFRIAQKYFNNVAVLKDGTQINFGYKEDCEKFLEMGIGSENRRLPQDILTWNTSAIKSLIGGIIDSDGNVNTNGVVTIRVAAFALVQQVAEILRTLHCGNIRTGFMGIQQSNTGFKTNLEMYRLSVRLVDEEFEQYSEKIALNKDIVYKTIQKDGRFETNKIHKIESFENEMPYVYDITTETGHFHCQGLLQHNCFNYSTYDIMANGLPMIKKIKSMPPKYLHAFKSQLEQFTIIASNSTLGATGLADLLVILSYYTANILKSKSDAHYNFVSEEDCWIYVKEMITSFIYSVNFSLRANQSPFTNISVYDKYFLEKLAEDYIFPDGSQPDIEIVKKLQEMYLDIMNQEMRRTPVTFPVTTACFSIDENNDIRDEEFLGFIAEKNKEFGFINIYCGDSSTLSSCCRLRSEQTSEYFNSFGSGSSKIGSLGVCSINFPRLAIKSKGNEDQYFEMLKSMVEVCVRVNNAKRHVVQKRIDNGNEPLYTLGYMDLSKQYSTIGINGLNECLEIMGYDILNDKGVEFALQNMQVINTLNKKFEKKYDAPHNCEQVPGESMSVKMAEKDKLLGYQTKYNIYSNQFIPLVTNADMLDRIRIQGILDKHFSGGAICHINVDTPIHDTNDIKELIRNTAKMGVVYHAINYNLQECANGHMSVGRKDSCEVCGSEIVNNYTRVVGFLTNTKNWHKVRREEDYPERQFYEDVKV